ncbi:MAG: aldehyde dehydrogenase family protein [Alphaproteobacteria bacterium]|nr:aldehyde dehydrogenase family protein [Alphaproteobacteria bacterium]
MNATQAQELLSRLGIDAVNAGAWIGTRALPMIAGAAEVESVDPTTGRALARMSMTDVAQLDQVVQAAQDAFARWRTVPAPKRGEVVRLMGEKLRAHKDDLGRLVTLEVGKTLSEGLGEVQESIDMADLAVGMSRQLFGLSMHSERASHRMYEQWQPLGPVGIITAFNFPNAVWAWNAMVALIAGDPCIWKPSLKAPLTALATHKLLSEVAEDAGFPGLLGLVVGADADVGEAMIHDGRLPLISATGSVRMGRHVNQAVAARLGRCLLELGGNNAIIVDESADLELALRGIAFGACGTAGQRCTSTRRLMLHESIAEPFIERLVKVYQGLPIGDPMDGSKLIGPLIDQLAVDQYLHACDQIRAQGGEILTGGKAVAGPGFFVEPTLVRARHDMPIVHEETFAPILYVMTWSRLEDAIAWNNEVPQGLSSAIFTDSFRHSERFLSPSGSDCGIANVNIGTSGAEIGGAFGGEKETGGGREAGSDSWKAYMRRQTCTLNWGTDLPLAQGVTFDV